MECRVRRIGKKPGNGPNKRKDPYKDRMEEQSGELVSNRIETHGGSYGACLRENGPALR